MEAFSAALKVFLEKHFIPTILALVVGVIAFYFTPDDNAVLIKLGREWYVLLLAGIAFLVITLIVKIYHVIQKRLYYISLRKNNEEYDQKKVERNIRLLWDRVDTFSIEDRKLLEQFLATDNSPIERGGYYYCSYESLLGSDWVKSRQVNGKNGFCTQYILDDQIFQCLKYSKEKYGRIGNFKEEV